MPPWYPSVRLLHNAVCRALTWHAWGAAMPASMPSDRDPYLQGGSIDGETLDYRAARARLDADPDSAGRPRRAARQPARAGERRGPPLRRRPARPGPQPRAALG